MSIPAETQLDKRKDQFAAMLSRHIVFAPWLSSNGEVERVSRKQKKLVDVMVRELTDNREYSVSGFSSEKGIALSTEFAYAIHRDFLISTALYLSSMRLGTLVVTDEMIHVGRRIIEAYLEDHGSDALVENYMLIASYENGQVLDYYGTVQKDVFVSGKWHRPWAEYSLQDELDYCCQEGITVIVADDRSHQLVKLTPQGKESYEKIQQIFVETEYLKQRANWIRISHFTNLEEYDTFMDILSPDSHYLRKELLKHSGITRGMKVLELGCGTGGLTLDDGLHQKVGSEGQIVGVDLSSGMLARAEIKRKRMGAANVRFVQADAEDLPFRFSEFDAVVGSGFLHFTDMPKVFHEVNRVAKKRAPFVTMFPLQFPVHEDFFKEWFGHLIQIQERENTDLLLTQSNATKDVPNFFHDYETFTTNVKIHYDNPEVVVKFFVEVVNAFDGALSKLPWRARQEENHRLIKTGREIIEKYGKENVRSNHTFQWIKALNT